MIGTGEGDSPGAQGPPLRSGHPADTSPVKAEGESIPTQTIRSIGFFFCFVSSVKGTCSSSVLVRKGY